MADRKPLNDLNETPEDVATLYSWANLHGAKYRDFSASRAQTREEVQQCVQQAIEEEREQARKQAETDHAAELKRAAAPYPSPEITPPAGYRSAALQPRLPPLREESYPQPRASWAPAESASRPAWLTGDRADITVLPARPAPQLS